MYLSIQKVNHLRVKFQVMHGHGKNGEIIKRLWPRPIPHFKDLNPYDRHAPFPYFCFLQKCMEHSLCAKSDARHEDIMRVYVVSALREWVNEKNEKRNRQFVRENSQEMWRRAYYGTKPGGSLLWSQYFGRLRLEDHLRPGAQDQPWQHSKTLCLQKK